MSKRPTEVLGKKIVYRYSGPVIATMILSLLAVGTFIAALFLPFAGFIEEIGVEGKVTGIHYFFHLVGLFTGQKVPAIENLNAAFVNAIMPGNGVATLAVQVWSYVMAISLLFMAIYTLVLAIGLIVLIFRGHLNHWKLPYSMTKRIFLHGINYFGIICMINIFGSFIRPQINPGASPFTAFPSYFSYGFWGLLFVLTIVIHVIYSKCFKDHVYVKNEKTLNEYITEYEKESVAIDTTTKEDVKKMAEATKAKKKVADEDEIDDGEEEAPKAAAPAPIPAPIPAPVPTPAPTETKILVANNNEGNEAVKAPKGTENVKTLPKGIKHIGGHAFSQNTLLEEANIPEGIDVLGAGAFANCVNLRVVYIPVSMKKIEYNCFFNCIRLEKISYGGKIEQWMKIKKGSNWLTSAGTKVVICRDGAIKVDPKKS